AIVKSMLDHGADVKVKNADGWTALHIAAELDQLETVKMLVKQGANIHARTNDGQTALDIAKKSDLEPAATIRYLQSLMAAKPKAPALAG
ncbi:MAG: ankyrin repeat domain-containing protein, partial [Alphaproteobacteria bacterium]|nr:ankyrin repeat domain-containing protein [Alphaproteobacteria bacterium]